MLDCILLTNFDILIIIIFLARVLCVAWNPNGKVVCAGDADGNIRVFQAESCKQKFRMNSKSSKNEPTRIWSIQFHRYIFLHYD